MTQAHETQLEQREPANRKFIDMIGWQRGKLTVTSFAGWHRQFAMWNVRCDCGHEFIAYGHTLRHRVGKVSCKKCARNKPVEWHAWKRMCRVFGKDVCEAWRLSYSIFVGDMGPAPEGKHCIGRREHESPFNADNCVWCDGIESNRLRVQRLITYQGVTQNISEWAAKLGISRERMRQRFESHSIEQAITYQRVGGTMARARKSDLDPLIEAAVQQQTRAQLMRSGENFNGEVSAVRARLVSHARARGINLVTHKYTDSAFWVIALPKPEQSEKE